MKKDETTCAGFGVPAADAAETARELGAKHRLSYEELEMRAKALSLAVMVAQHDGTYDRTVQRAEAYLAFLRGEGAAV